MKRKYFASNIQWHSSQQKLDSLELQGPKIQEGQIKQDERNF